LRKFAAAALAIPVLATLYLPVLMRRTVAARVGLALGVGAILGVAVVGITGTHVTTAGQRPANALVASAQFSPAVRTNVAPVATVAVDFATPMDRASVESHLSVSPAATVSVRWDAQATHLTIAPSGAWAPATYYTVTVGVGAADAAGRALTEPARTIFLTRAATTATILATAPIGKDASVESAIVVRFSHAVDLSAATAAFRISPAVDGTFVRGGPRHSADSFTFIPADPLTAGSAYSVTLAGAIPDADGLTVTGTPAVTIRTTSAPSVMRFRPRDGTKDVPRNALLSVRFTQSMSRKETGAAFHVTVADKPVTGTVTWAENDRVLVFSPRGLLSAGSTVVMTVDASAVARTGLAVDGATKGTFQVVKAPGATPAKKSAPVPIAHPGGSVGGASWTAVEGYYLKLMNCTRTGGWVTSSGTCSSPGGLSTAPIVMDAGLSAKVSRPYAKYLAAHGACTHFALGTPTDRLHKAGYSGWAAENIGCRSASNAYASVLGTHLYFQTEKPCSGYCHYANLMNPAYKRCGIGVWLYGGRIRLVIDFLHP
jgi:hypothetical protein